VLVILRFQLRLRTGHGPFFWGLLEAMLAFFKTRFFAVLVTSRGKVFWFPRVTNVTTFVSGKNFTKTCTIGDEPLHHNYLQKPHVIMVSISLQCLYFGLQKLTGKRNMQDSM